VFSTCKVAFATWGMRGQLPADLLVTVEQAHLDPSAGPCHGPGFSSIVPGTQELALLDDDLPPVQTSAQFRENVRADQHGLALPGQQPQQFAQLHACPRVETVSLLVMISTADRGSSARANADRAASSPFPSTGATRYFSRR